MPTWQGECGGQLLAEVEGDITAIQCRQNSFVLQIRFSFFTLTPGRTYIYRGCRYGIFMYSSVIATVILFSSEVNIAFS